MDILRRTKFILAFVLFAVMGGANAESCKYFGGNVSVVGWKEKLPSQAVLYRYKKDSGFVEPIQISNKFSAHFFSPVENSVQTLIVRFSDYEPRGLLYDADYKLVVDNKYTYEISKIEPSEPRWGCLLYGGKVNECRLYDGVAGLAFNNKCAVSIK